MYFKHRWDTCDHSHLTLLPLSCPSNCKLAIRKWPFSITLENPSMPWRTAFNSITCKCVTFSLCIFWISGVHWCLLPYVLRLSLFSEFNTVCTHFRGFSVKVTVWVLVWCIDHLVDKVEALLTVLLSSNFTLLLMLPFHLSLFTFQVRLFYSPFYGRRFSIFLKLWYQGTPGLSLGNLPLSNLSI